MKYVVKGGHLYWTSMGSGWWTKQQKYADHFPSRKAAVAVAARFKPPASVVRLKKRVRK